VVYCSYCLKQRNKAIKKTETIDIKRERGEETGEKEE
jgi:hypothetical protein